MRVTIPRRAAPASKTASCCPVVHPDFSLLRRSGLRLGIQRLAGLVLYFSWASRVLHPGGGDRSANGSVLAVAAGLDGPPPARTASRRPGRYELRPAPGRRITHRNRSLLGSCLSAQQADLRRRSRHCRPAGPLAGPKTISWRRSQPRLSKPGGNKRLVLKSPSNAPPHPYHLSPQVQEPE